MKVEVRKAFQIVLSPIKKDLSKKSLMSKVEQVTRTILITAIMHCPELVLINFCHNLLYLIIGRAG